jgi:hypothetical protein
MGSDRALKRYRDTLSATPELERSAAIFLFFEACFTAKRGKKSVTELYRQLVNFFACVDKRRMDEMQHCPAFDFFWRAIRPLFRDARVSFMKLKCKLLSGSAKETK